MTARLVSIAANKPSPEKIGKKAEPGMEVVGTSSISGILIGEGGKRSKKVTAIDLGGIWVMGGGGNESGRSGGSGGSGGRVKLDGSRKKRQKKVRELQLGQEKRHHSRAKHHGTTIEIREQISSAANIIFRVTSSDNKIKILTLKAMYNTFSPILVIFYFASLHFFLHICIIP
ncbi:hypothetical protein ISN44_As02g002700 [Arabidopsis suecica]|uniref:Uncharacterized protein n=1 Tax=Arabidopsis suecica TaxID=45249 RepID=A0A8T2FXD1_ARASU|nr:hypothetical protein ISN44_As02g002700 [Arabidopsis suecica]